MTREHSTPPEIFVARLQQLHPDLDVSCDVPETPTGSTWIDIHAGTDWVVVEYHPELGFGFSDPRDETNALYGTPSSRFVRTADEALRQIGQTLRGPATPVPDARHDA